MYIPRPNLDYMRDFQVPAILPSSLGFFGGFFGYFWTFAFDMFASTPYSFPPCNMHGMRQLSLRITNHTSQIVTSFFKVPCS
jgi:hypothetical protein